LSAHLRTRRPATAARALSRTRRRFPAASFPEVAEPGDRISFRAEFFGAGYASATAEAAESLQLADKFEGIDLDITYTAKALACALADLRAGLYPQSPVLFWNTRNSGDLSDLAAEVKVDDLPRRLRGYFEPDSFE